MSVNEFVNTNLEKLEKYIDAVTNGKIACNKYEVLAVRRFLALKGKYHYAEKELIRVLKFFSYLQIELDEKIQQVQLIDWQVFVLANLYGLYTEYQTKKTNLFNFGYITLAKKNGKTSLNALIAIYEVIGRGRLNSNVYMLASSTMQATIALDYTKLIIQNSKSLKEKFGIEFEINRNIIYNRTPGRLNKIEVRSADKKKIQGIRPAFVCVDELATHPDSELMNRAKSAQIGSKNGLMLAITTAINNIVNPAYELQKTCENILEGIVEDDSTFALIYTLDDYKTEAHDKRFWRKANPSIDHLFSADKLEKEFNSAKIRPSSFETLLTDNLNVFIESRLETWIEDEIVVEQMKEDRQIPLGSEIYCSLDLSSTSDLSSIGLLWHNKAEDIFITKTINIFPNNEKRRIREGSIDLQRWIDEGHIIRCKDAVLDEQLIYDLLRQINDDYKIQTVGYDPWNSKSLIRRLENELEIDCYPVPQNMKYISYPMKCIEVAIVMKKMFFHKSPVLRWMFRNSKLQKDGAGNIKYDKKKSEAIDGVVAIVIAFAEWLRLEGENSEMLNNFFKKLYRTEPDKETDTK